MLLAKVNQSSNARTEGRCRIQAEGDYDDSNRGLREQGTPEGHNLQLIHTLRGDRHGGARLPRSGRNLVGRRTRS